MIVAHLDLDAFYAAVEELENPELRSQPLIVGGDPRGRGVVATANYVARAFGIHSAMSAAEAIRRCPHAVFVRPRHALYREYSRHVWSTVRGVVPTRRADRDRRGLPRSRRGRRRLPRGARRRGGGADRRARRDEPHVLARRRAVQGRREDRQRRAQARRPRSSSCPGQEAAFLAPLDVRKLPGRRARRRRSGCAPPASRRSARSRRSRDDDLRRLLPGSVGSGAARPRARHRPAGLELDGERISISVENTFERDLVERERLHDELRAMATEVAEHLQKKRTGRAHRDDEAPLRRLLDPQPLDLARRRHRRRRADRRPRLPPARPRPPRPPRARSASSASASRGSPPTGSSRSTPCPRRQRAARLPGLRWKHTTTPRISTAG